MARFHPTLEKQISMSYVHLLTGQLVREGENEVGGTEVEDETEGDGDRQRWESLLEDGQKNER